MTALRYLLVGNAPNPNLVAAKHADIIVQINTCPHAETLPQDRTRYVFITNTGHATSPDVVKQLCSRRALLPDATIILSSPSRWPRSRCQSKCSGKSCR